MGMDELWHYEGIKHEPLSKQSYVRKLHRT